MVSKVGNGSDSADISIRPASRQDLRSVYQILTHPRVVEQIAALPTLSPAQFENSYQPQLQSEFHHHLVAAVTGKVVGHVHLEVGRGRQAHLGDIGIAVHPSYQRQGIGHRLMMALIDLADNWLGLRRLQLEVIPDNSAAVALYHDFDFHEEGRQKRALLRGGELVDLMLMARLS